MIVPEKMYALWYSPTLPAQFYVSAIGVGLAMTIFESWHSSRAFGRALELPLLASMGRVLAVLMSVAIIVTAARLLGLVLDGAAPFTVHVLKPVAQGKVQVRLVPQTPVVLGGPPVQSTLPQQLLLATQAVLPLHTLKPVAQGKLHVWALPQTPVVLAGPPVHSLLPQQPPLVGTQSVVPGHWRNEALQLTPHIPALQTAVPLAAGAGQLVQGAPQKLALVSD